MSWQIDKDTVMCMSLSARPSNFGTRFHNHLYRALNLNYIYKAFATQDIEGAIRGVRALGIRGAAVSMPHKEAAIPLVDELAPSAEVIGAVNTIVNTKGHLKAYNTDVIAVRALLSAREIPDNASVLLQGSGGMAKAVAGALSDLKLRNVTVVARNPRSGPALAERYGFKWTPELRDGAYDVLLNVTPIGMAPETEGLAFPERLVDRAQLVLDTVASPSETTLIKLARSKKKKIVTGFEIVVLQAVEQFELYTGIRPPAALVAEAGEVARV